MTAQNNIETRKRSLNILSLIALTVAFSPAAMAVTLPAGSVDQLAAAIAEAGLGGQVVLERGVHRESSTVWVNTAVSIVGEDGAVLESYTQGAVSVPMPVQAALHITAANGARVENLTIRAPQGFTGSCGIVIEDSAAVQILDNRITGHQLGILIHHGDQALIKGNTLRIAADPASGRPENGIVVINGDDVSLQDNWVTGAAVGIFLSGRRGAASGNTTEGNVFGMMVSTTTGLYEISGAMALAATPATEWTVFENQSVGNDYGYLVIDGAHGNVLTNNSARLNKTDLELAGESDRFGLPMPASHDNFVMQGDKYGSLTVIDGGTDNSIQGRVIPVETEEAATGAYIQKTVSGQNGSVSYRPLWASTGAWYSTGAWRGGW